MDIFRTLRKDVNKNKTNQKDEDSHSKLYF